jgi:heat shock protein HslJ
MKISTLFVLFFLLAACTAQESTPEPAPTMTPPPTSTPASTYTPVKANTPRPTTTTAPTPSPTLEPTSTPMLTGYSALEDTTPDDIKGVVWQWQSFQDTAGINDIVVDEPSLYTLALMPGGTAAIQAGCNVVSLGYILEDNSLSFSQAGPSTTAECGSDSLDQQYLALLTDTAAWVMTEQGELVLNLKFDGGNMFFNIGGDTDFPDSQPESVEPDITGILWEWQSFLDTAGINDIIVDDPGQYSLILGPDGVAAIQADCNQYGWNYSLDGSGLTFDDTGVSTQASCGGDSLDQQYLELLSNVATWIMTGDGRLYLNLWADGGDMVFAPSALNELVSISKCSGEWFMADGSNLNLQLTPGQPVPSGCPQEQPLLTFAATQSFENGRMIWLESTDTFYILFNEGALPFDSRQAFITLGPFRLKPGASVDNRIGVDPPTGLFEPVSGFGHIWRNEIEGMDLDIRDALGWGLASEFGFDTALQCQEQQTYSERTCYLLESDGSVLTLSAHAIAGNVWWREGE